MSREGVGPNGKAEKNPPYSGTPCYLTHRKSYLALYFEVIYSRTAQFRGNKAIKPFTFGILSGSTGFGGVPEDAIIPLSFCTCMLLCLVTPFLTCISKIGSTSFSPTKDEASMERPVPPFIKASEKAPLLKECHLWEGSKHWSQPCVFARPPELILSNFSAPLVLVIKEAWAFKWAGSLVALSSYHIGLQSGLQCDEGDSGKPLSLARLKTLHLPLFSRPSPHLKDKTPNTPSEEVGISLFCDIDVKSTQLPRCSHLHTYAKLIKAKLIHVVIIF